MPTGRDGGVDARAAAAAAAAAVAAVAAGEALPAEDAFRLDDEIHSLPHRMKKEHPKELSFTRTDSSARR